MLLTYHGRRVPQVLLGTWETTNLYTYATRSG
jgi:hypothetical protein